jgi:hypothetical protein
MMVNGDLKGIQDYEKIWRKNHKIKKDQPSNIFVDPVKSGSWAA